MVGGDIIALTVHPVPVPYSFHSIWYFFFPPLALPPPPPTSPPAPHSRCTRSATVQQKIFHRFPRFPAKKRPFAKSCPRLVPILNFFYSPFGFFFFVLKEVRACVRACMCVCGRACVRACARAFARLLSPGIMSRCPEAAVTHRWIEQKKKKEKLDSLRIPTYLLIIISRETCGRGFPEHVEPNPIPNSQFSSSTSVAVLTNFVGGAPSFVVVLPRFRTATNHSATIYIRFVRSWNSDIVGTSLGNLSCRRIMIRDSFECLAHGWRTWFWRTLVFCS